MLDLSDWIWLAVVVLWVVLRAVGRLFRRKAERGAAPSAASTPAQPPPTAAEPERIEVGPEPIEPR